MSSFAPSIRRGFMYKRLHNPEAVLKRQAEKRAFRARQDAMRKLSRVRPAQGITRDFTTSNHNLGAAMDIAPPKSLPPKNLQAGLDASYPGLHAALNDTTLGHQAVSELFPFTSESSVRRWRKKNNVELVK